MNSDVKKLLDLIGSKEAPRGYDQMYWRAERSMGRHKLTSMTLDQVRALQQKMVPYGSTACGKYQFIRATFDTTRNAMSLSGNTVWTPEVQDEMAAYLLDKRGLTKCIAGQISREDFANNLAKEWASLPVVTHMKGATRIVSPGQSYYSGDGLNKSFHKPQEILACIDALHAQPVVTKPTSSGSRPIGENTMPEPITANPNEPVIISSPLASRINWTQVIALVAAIAAGFGFIISPEWQNLALQIIAIATPVLTLIFRNIFTGNKTPSTPQLKAAIEDNKK